MYFGMASDQSILITLAAFTASVVSATYYAKEPPPTPTDIQSMINVVVSAVTCNMDRDYKILLADGWSYYCWLRGKLHNKKHISTTCKNEKGGHKVDATLENQMGGKLFI